MPVSISGTNGVTFPDSSLQTAAASPYVLKNRIINGGMDIWQRGTTGFTSGYTADRWFTTGGSSVTVARSTDTQTGYRYALAYSGSNFGGISQRIESYNTQDLVGQNATLSFWAKSISGNLGVAIAASYPTAQDNYTSATTISTEYIALTTSWAKYTISYSTLASGVANGIGINIFGSSGSATAFNLTGVQLEVGTSATPFERRLYNQELANCQRYYEKSYELLTAPGANTSIGVVHVSAASNGFADMLIMLKFNVQKRTAPTMTFYREDGTSGSWNMERSGSNTTPSVTSSSVGDNGGRIYCATGANWTVASIKGHWTSSAEL
jgi:hypothetical protein